MLGHPQPLGDFPLRQPLDLAKLEYPAASVRQSLDQSAHPVQFAAAPGDPFGRRFISNDVQALYFRNGFDADDTLAPQPHQDDAARGGEEIGTTAANMADILKRGDLAVGFLDDVFEVFGIERAPEPRSAERRVGQERVDTCNTW